MFTLRHLTDDDFESAVLKADHPVLVDFWATWCGPCKMMASEIEKLALRFGDRLEVAKMDVDAEPAAGGRLGIMSIPTIVLFRPGAKPYGAVGYRTADQLAELMGLAALPVIAAA